MPYKDEGDEEEKLLEEQSQNLQEKGAGINHATSICTSVMKQVPTCIHVVKSTNGKWLASFPGSTL